MNIVPGSALAAPSQQRVRWFERSYRVRLPEAYKDVLGSANGAELKDVTFEHAGNSFVMERLLCLLDAPREDEVNGWYDLTSVITQLDARLADDEDRLGVTLVPIAALFSGDFVCLDYRSSEVPTVVVWFHEASEDFAPAVAAIAPSFEAFVEMLSA